jgi:hypothetical protein
MTDNYHNKRQKRVTPNIINCWCGCSAKIQTIDIGQETMGKVVCTQGHSLTKYCFHHRAICLWNNRVALKLKEMNHE